MHLIIVRSHPLRMGPRDSSHGAGVLVEWRRTQVVAANGWQAMNLKGLFRAGGALMALALVRVALAHRGLDERAQPERGGGLRVVATIESPPSPQDAERADSPESEDRAEGGEERADDAQPPEEDTALVAADPLAEGDADWDQHAQLLEIAHYVLAAIHGDRKQAEASLQALSSSPLDKLVARATLQSLLASCSNQIPDLMLRERTHEVLLYEVTERWPESCRALAGLFFSRFPEMPLSLFIKQAVLLNLQLSDDPASEYLKLAGSCVPQVVKRAKESPEKALDMLSHWRDLLDPYTRGITQALPELANALAIPVWRAEMDWGEFCVRVCTVMAKQGGGSQSLAVTQRGWGATLFLACRTAKPLLPMVRFFSDGILKTDLLGAATNHVCKHYEIAETSPTSFESVLESMPNGAAKSHELSRYVLENRLTAGNLVQLADHFNLRSVRSTSNLERLHELLAGVVPSLSWEELRVMTGEFLQSVNEEGSKDHRAPLAWLSLRMLDFYHGTTGDIYPMESNPKAAALIKSTLGLEWKELERDDFAGDLTLDAGAAFMVAWGENAAKLFENRRAPFGKGKLRGLEDELHTGSTMLLSWSSRMAGSKAFRDREENQHVLLMLLSNRWFDGSLVYSRALLQIIMNLESLHTDANEELANEIEDFIARVNTSKSSEKTPAEWDYIMDLREAIGDRESWR